MAPKRPARGVAAATSSEQGESSKPKKRRVSLACDACRAAREKCDGGQPECGTCVAQQRTCSYTPATKKRGVQTGYLRTIELSLAWLFDQIPECEESLHHLLNHGQGESNKESRAILGKGSAGHRLQRLWNQNRVRKAIDGLLSDPHIGNSENSDNESDTDVERLASFRDAPSVRSARPTVPSVLQDKTGVPDRILKLPANWKRLLEVYVSYTHCWLPIVNPESLQALAASYPVQGVSWPSHSNDSIYLRHSELWAAMAIASYQDENLVTGSDGASPSASQILQVSRALLPADDEAFNIHSINATVIQAVILIGRGKAVAASLLLSKCVRLLRQLRLTQVTQPENESGFSSFQMDVVSVACDVLDVLTSVYLNQHPMKRFGGMEGTYPTPMLDFTAFDQTWRHVPEKSSTSAPSTKAPQMVQPIRTLVQLHALTSVLSDSHVSKINEKASSETLGPEDLVKNLDSRFGFCNSLVSSGSTPTIPSAYLVKLLFLTATIELASDIRPSLLSGFLETVDSCQSIFEANHTPPVVVLLLQLVQRRARVAEMDEQDRNKWTSVTDMLQNIWHEDKPFPCTGYPATLASDNFTQGHEQLQPTFTPMSTESGPHMDNQIQTRPRAGAFGSNMLSRSKPAEQFPFGYQDAIPNPHFAIDTPLTTHPNDGRVNTHALFPGNHRMSQNFDYDALFEDLGSIGYTDNLEMDSRFMTNLGFAPGCDLAEIFQGDFGV
ncbi:fungal zn(2)-Cys(6) binuclear cluster domain-containing protein [Pochonia chlamydosporia 170]|uniref:Fungal zn(2)-Cys(6) binuclear cluster domain-containing protein n=1 Tax=Pochonia chlamydosporia 170 TaxID=1380566 RepID=A0A179F2D5_METCM|nr:fungal zn(2)-Cys(6) binuclear cluster domain-containing protein [Pochonia chlamydosporia 170]OAQ59605.1 fungal zn(2)-Cys(6) binuclear cluster domain-containing protein [Pochonia chlamydosporia 170]